MNLNRRQRRLAKKQRARSQGGAEDRLAKGIALHEAGKLAAAERIYRGLLAAKSAEAQIHAMANYYLGIAADQQGDVGRAVENMRAALALDPANTEFLNGLAINLRKSGRLEEAVHCYEQAI